MNIKNFKELERFIYVENKNLIQIKINLFCKNSLLKNNLFFLNRLNF